jgi:hypothetical protein
VKNQALQGYAEIRPPARENTRVGEPRTFDVIDYSKDNEKTTVVVEESATKKRTPKKKSPVVKKEIEEEFEYVKEEPTKTRVTFKTDILETDMEVDYFYKDDNIVCLFYSESSPTKVRPKRGTSFSIQIGEDEVEVYSPGVYVPASHIGSEVAFFLVNPLETE